MTILHVNQQPAKFNTVQWDGTNWDEIQEALNPNLFTLMPTTGSQTLYINDAMTNSIFAIVQLNNWIVSFEYWGPDNNEFGYNFNVLTEEQYADKFLAP